ncbi:hypothetical protein CMI37_16180, partial [Candidatus Pacearchaeota archaeon]|nr:hypothetical protein [Candidatus Pacearchaeota archaeon]
MPQGYEQNRLPAGSTGPISPARARRNSNNLSGTSSVLREIGLNKADPEIALHIVREGLGSGVIVERIQEGEFAASYIGRAARGTEITPSAVSDNDDLLTSGWAYGYAGPNNGYVQAGFMQFEVDDTVSDAATGVPCRIIFKTSDGSAFSERVRIDKSGNVGIGITPTNKLHVVGNIQLNARGEVRFADSDSSHYTGIKSAATVSSSHTYTLPAAFPASNKILQSTDAGILSWESAGSGSGDITGVTIQTDSGSGSKATDEDGSADFILQGDSAGIDVTNSGATITVALDLNEISAGVAADGDSFVFVDANDSNANKKEAIADLATLFAGDGLTASSSVMAVNVDDSTIETNSDAIRIKDDGVTYAKIQNVTTTNRILGRDSSGAGVIEEITPANLRTMINVADGATATTDTNTTYSVSCVDGDNSDEEKIRLTAGGSGSGTDDVVLEAGTGLSIARSSDKITFTNTVSDTDTTYSISCVDGDNSDEEKIRLTAGGSGSGTDDIVLEAGTGLSIARSSDKITFTNTVSDTNTTYAISCVDGDNSDEEKIRLTAGGSGSGTDDIVLEAGTGLSIARSSDKITFTNTVSDTN